MAQGSPQRRTPGRYAHERTACERLLRALRERPVDPLQWLNEPAPDGGHRITRVAARIAELRRVHQIETVRRGRRVTYRLREQPAALPKLDPGMFERTVGSAPPRLAIFDSEDDVS